MFRIVKKFSFCASHQLLNLPEDHPCSRLHGHNYEIEIVLSSDKIDTNTGMLLDFRKLNEIVNPVINKLDHQNLNDILQDGEPSTCEYLAKWIFQKLKPKLSYLTTVCVSETPKTWAEYSNE